MFNFEHTRLAQTQFEKLAQLLTQFQNCYATSKFDVGKIKVELNLPLKQQLSLKSKELLAFHSNYKIECNMYSIF